MKKEVEYKIFKVDVCEQPWAIEYSLVGAKSKKDLLAHWDEIFEDKASIKNDARITPIPDAFTTVPYKILDTFSYYE